MSEEILKKQIKSGDIGSLYLLYGEEEYLKRNYTGYIAGKLIKKDFELLNKSVLEDRVTPEDIINNCRTMPVFSDRRITVVKRSGLFKSKTGGGKPVSSKKRDDLAEFFQDMPKHVCLMFIEDEIDKRLKYVNLVKKHGLVVELNYRKPPDLIKWIIKMTRAEEHEIDPATAALLVEYCEPGMDDIHNELAKLFAFTGIRSPITMDDVERVCTKSIKSRVFDLTDAIAAGKLTMALSLLNDMVVLREPMPKILFMIARQLRQLLQLNMMCREGRGQSEIAARFKLHPYILGKIEKQARSFSMSELENAISTALELDLAIKTGRIDGRIAVELLITSMCS